MHFRKSFRGYNVDDVNAELQSVQAEIDSLKDRQTELITALNELQDKQRTAEARLEEKDREIRRLQAAKAALEAEQEHRQNAAEKIGTVYIKAFETGREIAMTPQPRVEQYLTRVGEITAAARLDAAAMQDDFAAVAAQVAAMVEDIDRQAAELQQRLEQLRGGVTGIVGSYDRFDAVKDEVQADIAALGDQYAQSVSDYLQLGEAEENRQSAAAPAAAAPAAQPQPVAEAPVAEAPTVEAPAAQPQPVAEAPAAEAPVAEAPAETEPAKFKLSVVEKPETAEPQPAAEEAPAEEEDAEEPAEPNADEEQDTLSDFCDSNEEADAALGTGTDSTAPLLTEMDQTMARGQNILNLLSKYQKK